MAKANDGAVNAPDMIMANLAKNPMEAGVLKHLIEQAVKEQTEALMATMKAEGKAPLEVKDTLDVAKLSAFFKPENKRPLTELYCLSAVGFPNGSITLISGATKYDASGHVVSDEPSLSYRFAKPMHGVGCDLWDRRTQTGYSVMCIDWMVHPLVRITEDDIAKFKAVGPISDAVRVKDGIYSMDQVLASVAKNLPPAVMKRGISSSEEGIPRYMDGEVFRAFVKPIYEERMAKIRRRKEMENAVKDVSPLDALLGRVKPNKSELAAAGV